MVVESQLSSISIAVGSVFCGGVTSGELIATRFFRGLGDKISACPAGGHDVGSFAVASCMSMGEKSELFERLSSSCCPEVSNCLGIVDWLRGLELLLEMSEFWCAMV